MITLSHFDKIKKLSQQIFFNSNKIANVNFQNKCKLNISRKTYSNDNETKKNNLNKNISLDNKKDKLCSKGISLAIIGGGSASVYMTVLLKQNSFIKEIRLIDMDNSFVGPICDMRQIDTSTVIQHYKKNSILDGLRNIDIVALMDESNFIMANRDPYSQFIANSNYVKSVTECIISACPKALIAIFAHPITATLPLVSEIFKMSGDWDPDKIFGSAALELMRISAMTALFLDLNPSFISIPIAGGIDPLTVVPLFSRTKPFNSFTNENECLLLRQLRSADMNLFRMNAMGPSLSSGVAAAKFISILVNGLKKENMSITSAYVRSDIFPSCQYMTSEIKFGPSGVQQNFGLPKMSSKEIHLVEQAASVINKITKSATNFIHLGKVK